jgi:hypothetical protein
LSHGAAGGAADELCRSRTAAAGRRLEPLLKTICDFLDKQPALVDRARRRSMPPSALFAADLPVVQATKFDFVINMQTAKALGRAISPHQSAIDGAPRLMARLPLTPAQELR